MCSSCTQFISKLLEHAVLVTVFFYTILVMLNETSTNGEKNKVNVLISINLILKRNNIRCVGH